MQRISPRQKRLLERARSGDPDYLAQALYQLVIDLDEPLSDEWMPLFSENRDLIEEILPEELFFQIEKRIASLSPIDKELENLHINDNETVCFLLGAGASAPAPSSIPTVMNLLPELLARARKIGRDDIDKLADWCEEHSIQNIEDLLTAAYVSNFAAKNVRVTELLDYFLFKSERDDESRFRTRRHSIPKVDSASIALLQDTLQVLFGLLTGRMIPAEPNKGHEAIVEFVKRNPKTSIITTNYDGCIDEALSKQDVVTNTFIEHSVEPSDAGTDLIKIHGSINWTYCDSCHDVREFDLLEQKKAFSSDSFSYAVIGICRNCGGQRRPLLIPPIGLKFIMFPSLISLWNAARERIERASYIIVVGYSFSDADTYINKIVERSMSINSQQKIIVCDPNPGLVDGLRKKYQARIEGFDERRILKAAGSADELLPKILKMGKVAKATRKKSANKKIQPTP
ncbi:MAG TPA: hypothetical protein ENK06_09235 [Gammaproteobacteria bacterium]|nr:hypothetical protein [Gammaproteobacteria bacterium]